VTTASKGGELDLLIEVLDRPEPAPTSCSGCSMAAGIWVASKRGPIREVPHGDRHRRLWRRHDLIAKTLFLR
jgi:hypothetical protein